MQQKHFVSPEVTLISSLEQYIKPAGRTNSDTFQRADMVERVLLVAIAVTVFFSAEAVQVCSSLIFYILQKLYASLGLVFNLLPETT
jgi:hypothetical protein